MTPNEAEANCLLYEADPEYALSLGIPIPMPPVSAATRLRWVAEAKARGANSYRARGMAGSGFDLQRMMMNAQQNMQQSSFSQQMQSQQAQFQGSALGGLLGGLGGALGGYRGPK